MTAVLLAGGKAIRVMPSSARLPKALMPVGALTVVEILLHQLQSAGLRRVFVCTGRHGDLIEAVVGDGERFGMEISFHREPTGGTASAAPLDTVRALLPDLPDAFLMMNAGTQCTLDFREFFEAGRSRGAPMTVAVHEERHQSRYGVADLDAEGRVKGFAEKPLTRYWADMGIYVCRRAALARVSPTGATTPAELAAALVAQGDEVAAHRFSATWLDHSDDRTSRGATLGARARYTSRTGGGSGLVTDLSLHGMLLVTDVQISVETAVTLEWTMPGGGTDLSAQGVVTGVTGSDMSVFAVGIRFTRVSEQDHAVIDRYLSTMHEEAR
ncbi:MAG: sugar phosphate nucleotidyltransferase [Vicinamibacterales bacterium]